MMKLGVLPRDANVSREIWKKLRPETRFALLGLGLVDFGELRIDDVAKLERAAREGAMQ